MLPYQDMLAHLAVLAVLLVLGILAGALLIGAALAGIRDYRNRL